ncbi:MAG TPA: hypothetical protein VKF39_03020 [Nitrososphaerales archaeon]|jgi:hypothetical protein|nr:hypothetical protein [Nitrososphaerales archaeon]
MEEMFTEKTPIGYYERMVVVLRNEGKNEEADRLAYLIASIKYRKGLGLQPGT